MKVSLVAHIMSSTVAAAMNTLATVSLIGSQAYQQ
jgi:hypothetical protein